MSWRRHAYGRLRNSPLTLTLRSPYALNTQAEFKMRSEIFFSVRSQSGRGSRMASRSWRPIDAYVGRRARQRRLELGISCRVVAQSVLLSVKRLQKFEEGFVRLRPAKLADVAAALQVPLGYFYGHSKPAETLPGLDVSQFQGFGPRLTPSAAQQLQENAGRQKHCTAWMVTEKDRYFYAVVLTEDGIGSGWLAAESLTELRQYLPLGLVRSDVQPSETPGVIEIWLYPG